MSQDAVKTDPSDAEVKMETVPEETNESVARDLNTLAESKLDSEPTQPVIPTGEGGTDPLAKCNYNASLENTVYVLLC